jgi:pyruvate formate lyase activating enzyme
MIEAAFYSRLDNKQVSCNLCPHQCIISESHTGKCRARKNIDGILYSEVYGRIAALHMDPIEKKPLYHFFPGKPILSVGTVGCNLQCKFCQNWTLSQTCMDDHPQIKTYTYLEIADLACQNDDSLGVAYTYNEPSIFFEFMRDTGTEIKKRGKKNVMVSNGYINREALAECFGFMDAFSIDLKAFSEEFYSRYTRADLIPVLSTLKEIALRDKHLEITSLIIPGLNDNQKQFEEMVKWIASECGKDAVLHLSRYFPNYRMNIDPTPASTLIKLYEIACKYLHFVYLGNVSIAEIGRDTLCPACKHTAIERKGYNTSLTGLDLNGNCNNCGEAILARNVISVT